MPFKLIFMIFDDNYNFIYKIVADTFETNSISCLVLFVSILYLTTDCIMLVESLAAIWITEIFKYQKPFNGYN